MKLGKAISQHSLWKKSSSFKMKRSIKIRRHGFVEEIYVITFGQILAKLIEKLPTWSSKRTSRSAKFAFGDKIENTFLAASYLE